MSRLITILGDGAFGTAIALVLADNGHNVILWSPQAEVASTIQATRQNTYYLPGVEIPSTIHPTADLNQALCQGELIFEAIPVKYLRTVAQKAFACDAPLKPWVCLSKGIELKTGLLPSQIVNQVFGTTISKAAIMGPSFARDIANKALTGVVCAGTDDLFVATIESLLTTTYFKIYSSADVIGVQLAAALKNVIALAIGMLDGGGYADNTKAYVLTRGLSEIGLVIQAYNGDLKTVYSFAGVGDVFLTCLGKTGRNLEVGRRLGQGQSLELIINQTGYTIESLNTLEALPSLEALQSMNLPVLQGLRQVVYDHLSLKSWLELLVSTTS